MANKMNFYKVSGGLFPFPIDMLRYDRAYPRGEHDSELIIQTYVLRGYGSSDIPNVQIELVSHQPPAVERWASFGWTVLESYEINHKP